MKLYVAPMEGITGYIFRNALAGIEEHGLVKFFTPFIVPRVKRGMQRKEERDLLPENNKGIYLVPQILCKRAEDFVALAEEIHEKYGYEEFNLNAGCPSGTVCSRGRGAGMLKEPEQLDRFLYELFSHTDLKVSVKTRMGINSAAEFERLLEIYEKYPLCELIVHARVLNDQYRLPARFIEFNDLQFSGKYPLVYNGDIYVKGDAGRLKTDVQGLMLGRGIVENPALGRELNGGAPLSDEEFLSFYERIYRDYCEYFDSDTPLLFHMKELWTYWGKHFPEAERSLKVIRKANERAAYEAAVREVFSRKMQNRSAEKSQA